MNTENVAVSGLLASVPSFKAPSAALKLDLRLHGNVAVLHCRGRLVYRQDTTELVSIVADILALTRRLVVDLTHVDRIDSAGLGELVTLHMWAAGMGHSIAFVCPINRVRELLELTNLTSLFDVHDSFDDAVRALRQ